MPHQQPTPPLSPRATPPLVLCADGGGSKICVVIRSADGLEVRGIAGPCNVQSIGHAPAIQTILLATYRALARLPASHLPEGFTLPNLTPDGRAPIVAITNGGSSSSIHTPKAVSASTLSARSIPATPHPSRPPSPKSIPVPPLNMPIFRSVWLGLAGISSSSDIDAFAPVVMQGLNLSRERLLITNDVNLLAAPALQLRGIKHVCAVVCGTGTVGRTIEIANTPEAVKEDSISRGTVRQLPIADVGVSKGWGWLLCDEGSAFWIGRLAIRSLLSNFDRSTRSSLYSTPAPSLLPLHIDLLSYFGVQDPMELIGICSLIGPSAEELSIGEATAKRNAYMAGAARTILRWAFPDDASPPSPPASERSVDMEPLAGTETDETKTEDEISQSRKEALRLVNKAIKPMVELTIDLIGDGSVVKPQSTVLALGGGLWQSKGYRNLMKEGLKKEGVEFARVLLVDDAAGVGAEGLASVEF